MGRLQGKVALLTGAGAGIARAAAVMFAREGAKVLIAEIDPERGRGTEQLARDAGGDAVFVPTDVTDEASVKQAVAQAVERYGRLSVLFNCAGGSVPEDSKVTEVDLAVWDRTMTLDL